RPADEELVVTGHGDRLLAHSVAGTVGRDRAAVGDEVPADAHVAAVDLHVAARRKRVGQPRARTRSVGGARGLTAELRLAIGRLVGEVDVCGDGAPRLI